MTTVPKFKLALFVLTIALFSGPAKATQVLTFSVDLNTASLAADAANAPFYLDFALSYGNSALATNTAMLSNFSFTGGGALGSAVTTGMVSGSLANSVLLTANSAHTFSEFYQMFAAGVTDISFLATITEPGPDVGTPTFFSVAILDSALGFPAQLYTTAPDTLSLVTLDLSSSNTFTNINTYSGYASSDGNTPLSVVATVPDSGTTAAFLGLAALALASFNHRRKQMI